MVVCGDSLGRVVANVIEEELVKSTVIEFSLKPSNCVKHLFGRRQRIEAGRLLFGGDLLGYCEKIGHVIHDFRSANKFAQPSPLVATPNSHAGVSVYFVQGRSSTGKVIRHECRTTQFARCRWAKVSAG